MFCSSMQDPRNNFIARLDEKDIFMYRNITLVLCSSYWSEIV